MMDLRLRLRPSAFHDSQLRYRNSFTNSLEYYVCIHPGRAINLR